MFSPLVKEQSFSSVERLPQYWGKPAVCLPSRDYKSAFHTSTLQGPYSVSRMCRVPSGDEGPHTTKCQEFGEIKLEILAVPASRMPWGHPCLPRPISRGARCSDSRGGVARGWLEVCCLSGEHEVFSVKNVL